MILNAKLEDAVIGQREDYVLIPLLPTSAMLEAAADYALAEDAAGVWSAMIKAHQMESTRQVVEIRALSMGYSLSSETPKIDLL